MGRYIYGFTVFRMHLVSGRQSNVSLCEYLRPVRLVGVLVCLFEFSPLVQYFVGFRFTSRCFLFLLLGLTGIQCYGLTVIREGAW